MKLYWNDKLVTDFKGTWFCPEKAKVWIDNMNEL